LFKVNQIEQISPVVRRMLVEDIVKPINLTEREGLREQTSLRSRELIATQYNQETCENDYFTTVTRIMY